MRKISWIALAALVLLALPAAAAEIHIQSGIDVWWTPADGATRADFQQQPIPAGFFCDGSAPYYGTIAFQGAPVVTSPEGILAGADTVIHRLDDVVLGDSGVGSTRVQVAALELRSISPVVTRCGTFNVSASLAGEQPITKMEITRKGEEGGSFAAPLSLNVRLTFTSANQRDSVERTLVQQVDLDAAPNSRWLSSIDDRTRGAAGYVTVDSDGDGQPETRLPGTSATFFADPTLDISRAGGYVCHTGNGHQHCYWDECANLGPYENCP